jgi:tetratricopeptide (TPR) repeat protein
MTETSVDPRAAPGTNPHASGRRRALLLAGGGIIVWLVAGFSSAGLKAEVRTRGLVSARTGGEALASALGGFRGLAADFLWLRAFQMQEQGRYDETALMCKLILDLQPRFTGVWSFLAWNQAYNLAFEATTPAERWRWINAGMELLEKDGIRRNPDSYALYWELGYMYYFRVSYKGHDPMFRYHQEQIAPVPKWCADEYAFVDAGLWSDTGIRYRLYSKEVAPGRVLVGPPRGEGGYVTRAKKMYVVAVMPAGALVRATDGGRAVDTTPLTYGARLYADAPDRVAVEGWHDAYFYSEPSIPDGLSGAALLLLPDAEKGLDGHPKIEIEITTSAKIWVGWYPDETRNFHIARQWFLKAEDKRDAPRMMVARMRVHALVEAGEWEEAYGEFLELARTRPAGDEITPEIFRNFLLLAILDRWQRGDEEEARRWYTRLTSEFPEWGRTFEETVDWVTREWGE